MLKELRDWDDDNIQLELSDDNIQLELPIELMKNLVEYMRSDLLFFTCAALEETPQCGGCNEFHDELNQSATFIIKAGRLGLRDNPEEIRIVQAHLLTLLVMNTLSSPDYREVVIERLNREICESMDSATIINPSTAIN